MAHDPGLSGRSTDSTPWLAAMAWLGIPLIVGACTTSEPRHAGHAAEVPEEILAWEARVHELVNAHRTRNGLGPLRYDPALARIARDHSRDMAEGGADFSHDRLEWRVGQARGVRHVFRLGENIATIRPASSRAPATAVRRWLTSDDHRRVIEGCFDRTGVGMVRGPGDEVFITQLFARTAEAGPGCR